jgi:hypothetical protein
LVRAPNFRSGVHEIESPVWLELGALTKSGKILGVKSFYKPDINKQLTKSVQMKLITLFFFHYSNSGKLNQLLSFRYDLHNLVGMYSMLKEDAINITQLYKIFQTQPDIVGGLWKT